MKTEKLKKELSNWVLDVIRKLIKIEKECRKLEKEAPHMFKQRTQKIITLLESFAKEGEKKIDSLIGDKIAPVLDLLEDWLVEAKKGSLKKKTSKKRSPQRKSSVSSTVKKKKKKKKSATRTRKTSKQKKTVRKKV